MPVEPSVNLIALELDRKSERGKDVFDCPSCRRTQSLVVAPWGDFHSHSDLRVKGCRYLTRKARQCVTDQCVADIGKFTSPQFRFEDLADPRQWHGVDDSDGPNPCGLLRYARIGAGLELVGAGPTTGCALHIGDWNFTDTQVRRSDRRHGLDFIERRKGVLDHGRIDIMPATDNEVLAPARKPQIPIDVQASEIPRVVIALVLALDPRAIIVDVAEIAGKDVGPGDADTADLIGISGAKPLAVGNENAQVLIGQRQSDRSEHRHNRG